MFNCECYRRLETTRPADSGDGERILLEALRKDVLSEPRRLHQQRSDCRLPARPREGAALLAGADRAERQLCRSVISSAQVWQFSNRWSYIPLLYMVTSGAVLLFCESMTCVNDWEIYLLL